MTVEQVGMKCYRFHIYYWAYMDAAREKREVFLLNKRQMV